MKKLFLLQLVVVFWSLSLKGQTTKTLMMNFDSASYDLVAIGNDTLIAVGSFMQPYARIAGVVISTGEVFPLGDGLPGESHREFIFPSDKHVLYATIPSTPYLMSFNLTTQLGWEEDTYFGATNVITDVDLSGDKIVLTEGTSGYILADANGVTRSESHTGGSVNHVAFADDGSFFIGVHYGTTFGDGWDSIFHVTTGGEMFCNFGYIEKIYDVSDLSWSNGKLFFTSHASCLDSHGWHGVIGTYDPESGLWENLTSNLTSPAALRCTNYQGSLYVTGDIGTINSIETGVLAKYDGTTWSTGLPNSPYASGVGYALATTQDWIAVSGRTVTTLNPTYGKGQIIVSGNIETGINNPVSDVPHFELFPNPASTEFTIRGLMSHTVISITDIGGHVVMKNQSGSSGEMSIDVRTLASGIYFVSLQNDAGTTKTTNKLVVARNP